MIKYEAKDSTGFVWRRTSKSNRVYTHACVVYTGDGQRSSISFHGSRALAQETMRSQARWASHQEIVDVVAVKRTNSKKVGLYATVKEEPPVSTEG